MTLFKQPDDGAALGEPLGLEGDIAVGAFAGAFIGAFIGDFAGGEAIGDFIGDSIGEAVGETFGAAIGDTIGDWAKTAPAMNASVQMTMKLEYAIVTGNVMDSNISGSWRWWDDLMRVE